MQIQHPAVVTWAGSMTTNFLKCCKSFGSAWYITAKSAYKSTNGWHLLQAVERRTKDIGQANLRFQAKQAIIDSKFANELENWLRDIRNQAYIEIR